MTELEGSNAYKVGYAWGALSLMRRMIEAGHFTPGSLVEDIDRILRVLEVKNDEADHA